MRSRHLIAALACALMLPLASAHADAVRSADIASEGLTKSDFPRWKELAPGAYVYEDLHAPDRNGVVINTVSLVVVTNDGVVVVDGQGDEPMSRAMVDNIRKLTPKPIRYVVIASDHGDHAGGNAAFKAVYPNVVFISSPVSQRNLAKDKNPPTETVADKRTLRLGGTDIEILNLGRAHTGGDLVAYLPKEKVLFMSEVYLRGVFPAMRSAYPSEWVRTIEKAQAMNATWYIPGHGFIDDAAAMKRDLEQSRQALSYVITEAKRLHAAGEKCAAPTDCPAAQKANWGPYKSWAMSDSQGPLAIAKVYQQIEGKLPQQAAERT